MRLQIGHQPDEGALVRFQRRAEHRRQDVMILAVAGLHPGEAAIVELDPIGRIAGRRVLPGPEPEQHDPLVMRAGLVEQRLDEAEVELPLARLDLLPGDGNLDRVGMQPVEHRPDLRQRAGIVAGIVDLRAQHQEGLAIDDQRVAAGARDDMWHRGLLGPAGPRDRQRAQRPHQCQSQSPALPRCGMHDAPAASVHARA